MKRPELKQRDLDEVDRLVNIANATNFVSEQTKVENIRVAALTRAAQIMGIIKGDEDAKETD